MLEAVASPSATPAANLRVRDSKRMMLDVSHLHEGCSKARTRPHGARRACGEGTGKEDERRGEGERARGGGDVGRRYVWLSPDDHRREGHRENPEHRVEIRRQVEHLGRSACAPAAVPAVV